MVPGLDHEYHMELEGGGSIPGTWIIEFSDRVFANRWGSVDRLRLHVKGRTCAQGGITSQHDRRFLSAGCPQFLTAVSRGPSKPQFRVLACASFHS